MSPKSNNEFWATRMAPRFRIYNKVKDHRCMVSAASESEALANLKWRKEDCMVVSLGKRLQLPFVVWYVKPLKFYRKDPKND